MEYGETGNFTKSVGADIKASTKKSVLKYSLLQSSTNKNFR